MAQSNSYAIEKMTDGGYLVRLAGYDASYHTEVFACTDIGEALNYIRHKLIGRANAELQDVASR